MLTDKDIEARKPVWSALSELWLDTELQEGDLNWIAEIMFKSGFTLKELRKIYEFEVAPVVYVNLLSPAGEWAGFNAEWLHEKIISSLNSRSAFDRFFLKLKRYVMFYGTERHWMVLETRIKEMKHNQKLQKTKKTCE